MWPAAEKTYHRLVKTTPKPRATKNRRGELVGPELPPPPPFPVLVGVGADVVWDDVGADMAARRAKTVLCYALYHVALQPLKAHECSLQSAYRY